MINFDEIGCVEEGKKLLVGGLHQWSKTAAIRTNELKAGKQR